MQARRLRSLVIDADQGVRETLQRYGTTMRHYHLDVLTCSHGQTGLALLQQQQADILFVEYLLPDMTGLDLLHILRARGDRRPVIVLTGAGNERIAVAMMRAGADDYIVKGDLTPERLQEALHIALDRVDKENKRLEFEADLLQLARFDSLTNLCNRRYLMDRFAQEIIRARRYTIPLSVLLMDVDHFKQVNDTYGHMIGDLVLSTLAHLMREEMRATDVLGRYGGEEFCAVLPETPLQGAYHLAERVRQRVARETFPTSSGGSFQVTCSIGLAHYQPSHQDLDALLARADKALYQAKATGRNCVVMDTDLLS